MPDDRGGLRYVQTPSSIWGAETVFIDEISRCRPDLQNKLFPIIHERRVQGLLLDRLVYRWSAMNPPVGDDDAVTYHGSEPLDPALADRFAFIVEMPNWRTFSDADQERVILAGDTPVRPDVAERLRRTVRSGEQVAPAIREALGERVAAYIRLVTGFLQPSGVDCSARRAGMVLRNTVAVHAARHVLQPDGDAGDSALLALMHSLPDRATGQPINTTALLAAHREAWKTAMLGAGDPRRVLLAEPDPLRRALRALRTSALSRQELSGVVADAIAALPPGGRHALAAFLFESDTAGRLVAAVAEQCAQLFALVATAQNLSETVSATSQRHAIWQRITATLARLTAHERETRLASNLLVGLFARGELASATDVGRAIESWQQVRACIREAA